MKDQRGSYYYPFPQNKRARMYVRPGQSEIEFRLWNQDDPQMWEEHGWQPYSAIEQARALYRERRGAFDANRAYDLPLAEALLKEK